jgi:hypothetical protein
MMPIRPKLQIGKVTRVAVCPRRPSCRSAVSRQQSDLVDQVLNCSSCGIGTETEEEFAAYAEQVINRLNPAPSNRTAIPRSTFAHRPSID